MTDKGLWKLFLLFLEMNDCKGSYLYYARKEGQTAGSNGEVRNSDFLWSGFTWRDTRQGHDYWEGLTYKWGKVLVELRDAGHID